MQLYTILSLILGVTFALLDATAIPDLKDAPDVVFAYDFPRNPDGVFKIEKKTLVRVNMTNNSPLTKTVYGLTGYYTDKDDVLKNQVKILHDELNVIVKPGKTVYLKLRFTPIIDSGDFGILLLVDYYDSDEPSYKSVGALRTIKVIYADSMFDLQSIGIYVLLTLASTAFYYYFTGESAPVASTKKSSKSTKASAPKKVVEKVNTEPVAEGEVDMEWIPDHVKQTAKASRRRK
ncbi:hypothetical protein BC833DRAFT_644979 [Globomyces pollinis-pini]|nr:hypothetical protein BC833DRAFT_644979 [Globomyces pollinis-pini]